MTVLFTAKYVAGSSKPVFFITGKDEQGLECFYFVISTKEKIKNMLSIKQSMFNINDYGTVIESGFDKPSEELLIKLKNLYNLDL